MELYGHRVKFNNEEKEIAVEFDAPDGISPRINFDDLLGGFVAIFIIFIGEDWNSVMYDHVRSKGDLSILFFVAIFIFGNLVLLNLFLAILMSIFDS